MSLSHLADLIRRATGLIVMPPEAKATVWHRLQQEIAKEKQARLDWGSEELGPVSSPLRYQPEEEENPQRLP